MSPTRPWRVGNFFPRIAGLLRPYSAFHLGYHLPCCALNFLRTPYSTIILFSLPAVPYSVNFFSRALTLLCIIFFFARTYLAVPYFFFHAHLPCYALIFFSCSLTLLWRDFFFRSHLRVPCCALIFFFVPHISYLAVPLSCFALTLLCATPFFF